MELVFDIRVEIRVVFRKRRLERHEHDAVEHGAGLVTDTRHRIRREQQFGVTREIERVLALPLGVDAVTAYELLENRRVCDKLVADVVADVGQLAEQLRSLEPLAELSQVERRRIAVAEQCLEHIQISRLAVRLVADQDETLTELVAPIEQVADDLLQQ